MKVNTKGVNGAADAEARKVPIAHVVHPVDFTNDRVEFDEAELKELADSIRQHGLAQPPTLRPVPKHHGGHCRACGALETSGCNCPALLFEIVAGDRRTRAIRDVLEWTEMPALVREMDDETAANIMALENLTRKDLNPIEEAHAYRKRMEMFGRTDAEVAKALSKPLQHVRDRLKLLLLLPELQDMVRRQQVAVQHAVLIAECTPGQQHQLMRMYAKRPISMFDLKGAIAQVQDVGDDDQMGLFELGDQMVAAVSSGFVWAGHKAVVPVIEHPGVPEPVAGKKDTVGTILHRYMLDLEQAGLNEAASAVSLAYRALVKQALCNMGVNVFGKVPPPE
jgi:ParB/RepB/Spo0J family partition protein